MCELVECKGRSFIWAVNVPHYKFKSLLEVLRSFMATFSNLPASAEPEKRLIMLDSPLHMVWSWQCHRSATPLPRTLSSCPPTTGTGRCSWLEDRESMITNYRVTTKSLTYTNIRHLYKCQKKVRQGKLIACNMGWNHPPCPCRVLLINLK